MVDHFTKFIQLHPVKTLEAVEAAKCLMETFYKYGIPTQILSDQGTNFQAMIVHELCKLLDVRQTRTTAYHPQTDGISERLMRTIKPMIKAYLTSTKQDDWDENLNALSFAYNTARHETTKFSPFYLMFMRYPKIPLDLFERQIEPTLHLNPNEYAEQTQQRLKVAYEAVTNNTRSRMDKAKTHYDRNIRPSEFKVGDYVYKVDDAIKPKTANAFRSKRKGPYVIHEKINESIYIIKPLAIGTKSKQTVNKCKLQRAYTVQPYKTDETQLNPTQELSQQQASTQQAPMPNNDNTQPNLVVIKRKRGRPPKHKTIYPDKEDKTNQSSQPIDKTRRGRLPKHKATHNESDDTHHDTTDKHIFPNKRQTVSIPTNRQRQMEGIRNGGRLLKAAKQRLRKATHNKSNDKKHTKADVSRQPTRQSTRIRARLKSSGVNL